MIIARHRKLFSDAQQMCCRHRTPACAFVKGQFFSLFTLSGLFQRRSREDGISVCSRGPRCPQRGHLPSRQGAKQLVLTGALSSAQVYAFIRFDTKRRANHNRKQCRRGNLTEHDEAGGVFIHNENVGHGNSESSIKSVPRQNLWEYLHPAAVRRHALYDLRQPPPLCEDISHSPGPERPCKHALFLSAWSV